MAKRPSPREPSFTPASTHMDSDDDGITDDVQKPSKRLKTGDDSAAASPSVPAIHGPNDDEADNDADETEMGRNTNSKQGRTAIKAETETGQEAEVDADATQLHETNAPLGDTMADLSEDTDGDVPHARGAGALHGDDDGSLERQVTVCAWDGCKVGDLQTMDLLVAHLHAEHIEGRQRRYTCEWIGCPRKGKSHASAYALKAHLRSHTREKPYVCYLPECDQAFARADALNKHIRSAHDIDLMRSIDPSRVSVYGTGGGSGGGKGAHGGTGAGSVNGSAGGSAASNGSTNTKGGSSKLKIIIKTPQSHAAGQDDSIDYGPAQNHNFTFVNDAGPDETALTADQGFTARELELPLEKLYGLCRCQLRWAESENEVLRKECAAWEKEYYDAWLECQLLLDQVVKSEKDWHKRRQAVLAALAAEEKQSAAAAAAAAAASGRSGSHAKDEEDDSVVDEDNDNDDDDTMDADVTVDGFSFADASSFSVAGGSHLRNEVAQD